MIQNISWLKMANNVFELSQFSQYQIQRKYKRIVIYDRT